MNRKDYPHNWTDISHLVRFDIFGGRCMFCGQIPEKRLLACVHLDHDNRNTSAENLGAACCKCHARYDAADINYKRKYGAKYYLNQLVIDFKNDDDDNDQIKNYDQRRSKQIKSHFRGRRSMDQRVIKNPVALGRSRYLRNVEQGQNIGHSILYGG